MLLLVVSETGLVYTFTTAKLQPLVTQPEGKNLIQACLNAPAPQPFPMNPPQPPPPSVQPPPPQRTFQPPQPQQQQPPPPFDDDRSASPNTNGRPRRSAAAKGPQTYRETSGSPENGDHIVGGPGDNGGYPSQNGGGPYGNSSDPNNPMYARLPPGYPQMAPGSSLPGGYPSPPGGDWQYNRR